MFLQFLRVACLVLLYAAQTCLPVSNVGIFPYVRLGLAQFMKQQLLVGSRLRRVWGDPSVGSCTSCFSLS